MIIVKVADVSSSIERRQVARTIAARWPKRQRKGVAQNYKEAIKWYRKAADRGYKDAERRMKEICDETPSACE